MTATRTRRVRTESRATQQHLRIAHVDAAAVAEAEASAYYDMAVRAANRHEYEEAGRRLHTYSRILARAVRLRRAA